MPELTPSQRILRARIAAYAMWAQTEDRTQRTAPGRAAFMDRFERQVDPDGLLPPDERARRAEFAKKAHFQALSLRSSRMRRARREGAAVPP